MLRPPLSLTVIVHWSIKEGREREFLADRPWVPAGTAGFLDEELHRVIAIDGTPDGQVNFVNIGVWATREDFYAFINAKPGTVPPMKPYEAAERRREWLEVMPNPDER